MLPLRPAIIKMRAYVPGKTIDEVQRELGISELVKLNQNENPLGPSPKAVAAATAAMAEVHTYPEGSSRKMRERLAVLWELPADWFMVGNGSDEIFRLLAETYLESGDRVVVPAPSFAGYQLVAELMGAEVVSVPLAAGSMDLAAMAQAATDTGAKLLFLCRPNNPTGSVFSEDAFHRFMPLVPPGCVVILDEAYREFDETLFDSRSAIRTYPNLVVTRTFSKIYGMAGFRLGYGVMRPELIAPFYTVRDPFSVNNLAVAAGLAALDDIDHFEQSRALTLAGKRFMYETFQRLNLPYMPSQANFVLFDAGRPAAALYDALLHRGVLLRPCGSFGLPTQLRVTIGRAEENQRFAEVLTSLLRE